MKRRILKIGLACGLLLYLADTAVSAEREKLSLSLEEVSALALKSNFDIQLAKYDFYIKENDLLEVESVFDTIISGKIAHTDDQIKPASTITGTKSLTTEYELDAEKKFPSGTTIEAEFSQEREWSNSDFTTVNPSHDVRAKIAIKQELGKNFFGMLDRGDVRITKLDIENSAYTSLEKIEDYLAQIQKVYWQLVLRREEFAVNGKILKDARDLYAFHRDKKKLGLVEMPELFASEANVKKREREVILSANEVKVTENELLYRLDLNPDKVVIMPQDGMKADIYDMPEYIPSLKEALRFRRDYMKERNEAEAKKIKVAMKRNSLWPEINLEATFTRNGLDKEYNEAFQGVFNEDNPRYYIGIDFSFALENREAKGELNKAELEKARNILRLKNLERKIVVEIKDKVSTLKALINALDNSRDVAELYVKRLEAQKKRFFTGRSDTETLIKYQEELLEAELARTQGVYEVKAAEIDLAIAENSLLEGYWEGE